MPVSNNYSPLTASGFGIELKGVDLADLNEDTRSTVINGFYESGGALLIRDQQHLTPKQLCDFVSLFGSLEKNEKYNNDFILPDYPEILRLGNLEEEGIRKALWIKSDEERLWHSDDTFRHPQPIGSCLYCVSAPPSGGETWFAGMAEAYDALPEDRKSQIEPLTAVHSYNHLNELLRLTNPHRTVLSDEMKAQLPPITRPLVVTHPVTRKKALYITNIHIERINDMAEEDTRALLDALLAHATKPEFTFAHAWRAGDLVLWDNRSIMHAPSPFDDSKYDRLMYRLTVGGEQIVGA